MLQDGEGQDQEEAHYPGRGAENHRVFGERSSVVNNAATQIPQAVKKQLKEKQPCVRMR